MNAWYFTFEYPPEFGGGLSTYMRIVTDAYAARRDASLVIFCLSRTQSGLMSRRYLSDNVQLISINPHRSKEQQELGYWVNISHQFERFADLCMAEIDGGLADFKKPDYVEFADGFAIGTLTIQQKLCLNSRLGDIPILVTAHTPTHLIDRLNQLSIYKLPNYWTGRMELQALAGADLVIGCSQSILDFVGEELARTGASFRRSKVLHNPFPVGDKQSHKYGFECDHFYMASRLTHWKGVETAIKAFKILWTDGIEVPLRIFGEDTPFEVSGTQYSAYIKQRYGEFVERGLIQLMGKQPRQVISEMSKSAFAQLHPSHFDNFPYSLVEAMSEGTVCVAGLNGGIKEIAEHGKDLFLVDVHDAEGFARILKQVMGLSAKEREKIGRNAQKKVARHCDVARYFEQKEALVADVKAELQAATGKSFPFLSHPDARCVFPAQKALRGEPELSVVIPYFNMGAFIDETLKSVLQCSKKDLELVLVNDGSTDPQSQERLLQLHSDYGLSEEQLRIITIPNGGVANARNTGVRHARAPLVTLLDSDDLIGARYYEKAVNILSAYDNVSFCGAWIEDYNSHGRIRNWATWNAEPPHQLILNQTNCQSLVYKRAAFEDSGWHDPDLRMYLDDWEGVISLIAGGHRGVMIPEALFEYRIRANSIFRSNRSLWDINFEKITHKHRDLYNHWGADIAAFMNVNGPNKFYHILGKESALSR
nr:glycosyltransferase [uncultured Cohaesibacter sp.]